MIVDTSFLIDLMRGDGDAASKLEQLLKKRTVLSVASPTIFELFVGIGRSAKPQEERERIAAVLQKQMHVPFDVAAAENAGTLQGALQRKGNAPNVADAMIAGIALERNEPVLTRNKRDFAKFKELEIESY